MLRDVGALLSYLRRRRMTLRGSLGWAGVCWLVLACSSSRVGVRSDPDADAGSDVAAGGGTADGGSNAVLDDFDRPDGLVGGRWVGGTGWFSIANRRLHKDTAQGDQMLAWPDFFEADQELFVTLSEIDPTVTEMKLVMKAATFDYCAGAGALEVFYSPTRSAVAVFTCAQYVWTQHSEAAVGFAPGDRFGARAYADGLVEITRNGEVVDTASITTYDRFDEGGYIGVSADVAVAVSSFDDFGGGSL